MQTFTVELSSDHVSTLETTMESLFQWRISKLPIPIVRNLTFDERISHLTYRSDPTLVSDPCPICLNTIDQASLVPQLKCRHLFHKECLLKWFANVSEFHCPICRHSAEFDLPINRKNLNPH
jgi:hypothetical protein